jgi:Fe-S cluster assembly ATP-binding protein
MGPNASGKTTLIMTIIGYPKYREKAKRLGFLEKTSMVLPIYERIKNGIAISSQSPPEIRGVKLRDLIRLSVGKPPWNPLNEPEEIFVTPILTNVGLDPTIFRDRDTNVGFFRRREEMFRTSSEFSSKT